MKPLCSIACSFAYQWKLRGMFIAAVAAILLTACQKQDEESPEFTGYRINDVNTPDTLAVAASDTLRIEVACTDDRELNQLRIGVEVGDADILGEWEYVDVIPLTGATAQYTDVVVIPDSIEGEWILELQLADVAGNLADELQTILIISNALVPDIQLDAVNGMAPDEPPVISTGEEFQLEGTITDPDGLMSVTARLFTTDSVYLDMEWIPAGSPVIWDLGQMEFFAPDTALNMTLEIEAYDQLGFHNHVEYTIDIIE